MESSSQCKGMGEVAKRGTPVSNSSWRHSVGDSQVPAFPDCLLLHTKDRTYFHKVLVPALSLFVSSEDGTTATPSYRWERMQQRDGAASLWLPSADSFRAGVLSSMSNPQAPWLYRRGRFRPWNPPLSKESASSFCSPPYPAGILAWGLKAKSISTKKDKGRNTEHMAMTMLSLLWNTWVFISL